MRKINILISSYIFIFIILMFMIKKGLILQNNTILSYIFIIIYMYIFYCIIIGCIGIYVKSKFPIVYEESLVKHRANNWVVAWPTFNPVFIDKKYKQEEIIQIKKLGKILTIIIIIMFISNVLLHVFL